jgi:hypothetical protein
MTGDELIDDVWRLLPVRKHLLGRARVARIVERAMREWPVPVLQQCDAGQTAVVGKYLARSLERQEREYGMGFFASIILAAVIGEIVKILVRRWLENRESMMEAVR